MKKQKQTNKRIMKPAAATRPGGRPEAVPEGTARSAAYVISLAVHALVLLFIFFSAQFIKSTPTPRPEPQYQEIMLQFDVGVPGGTGTSVFDNQNPNPDAQVDNPDQGTPEVVETPADPTAPRQQTAREREPKPSQDRPDTSPHQNPAHQSVPAAEKPSRTQPKSDTTADNPWTRDGGSDNTNSSGDNNNNGNPSHGEGTEPAGPPPLPGTMTALPGWCRTKDDQNNSGAMYSHKGGTYRCNCTLGQGVTCRLVK